MPLVEIQQVLLYFRCPGCVGHVLRLSGRCTVFATKLWIQKTVPFAKLLLRYFLKQLCKIGDKRLDAKSKIRSYAQYIPHVYRTLKISDNLNSCKSVLDALDKIVRHVPEVMNEDELKDFVKRLGF